MINSLRKGLLPALRQVKGDDFSVAMPACKATHGLLWKIQVAAVTG